MKKEKTGITYRSKLIAFFLLATAITTLVGLYNYQSSRILMKDMTDLLNRTQEITTLYNEINGIQFYLKDYLSTRSTDSLQSFYDYSNSIADHSRSIEKDSDYTDRGIKIKNLSGMVDHYLSVLDRTVIDYRNKKTDDYISGYNEAVKEHAYIGNYIEEMMSTDLSDSAHKYIEIQREIDHSNVINYFLLGTSVILIAAIIVLFSFEITRPISKLASSAREIAKGNFDVAIPEQKTSSEIRILYEAFRKMTISIREYVNELHEKQRLERTLTEEKLNNLKMKSALNEAELLALQSQVNPHFIFNTINIGAKVAMLQGDNVTCEYLENFADIFRYNLKGLDYNAALHEEINNVMAYLNLLKARFGDNLSYSLEFPEEDRIRNFVLPRMTLQPLVENAYIHGISKLDDGGIIEIRVAKKEDKLYISISNTGEEIPKELINLILSRKYKKKSTRGNIGHTTGIGIDNVLNRLRLFYGEKDVMDINYDGGKTNVILMLPFYIHTKNDKEMMSDV